MCGLFSLSTMQPAVLSEQIGKSEQRNRESGKGVKGAHNCKGEMKTTMSSILQIYLLRTCMYVCMYVCMQNTVLWQRTYTTYGGLIRKNQLYVIYLVYRCSDDEHRFHRRLGR